MTAKTKARPRWDVWKLRPLPGEFNWTTDDAAAHLGITRQAVHRLVERGTLDARRAGPKPVILVREKDVRALPLSPQRKRELRLRGELPEDAGLEDELPEG
jgi:hypothetical protein